MLGLAKGYPRGSDPQVPWKLIGKDPNKFFEPGLVPLDLGETFTDPPHMPRTSARLWTEIQARQKLPGEEARKFRFTHYAVGSSAELIEATYGQDAQPPPQGPQGSRAAKKAGAMKSLAPKAAKAAATAAAAAVTAKGAADGADPSGVPADGAAGAADELPQAPHAGSKRKKGKGAVGGRSRSGKRPAKDVVDDSSTDEGHFSTRGLSDDDTPDKMLGGSAAAPSTAPGPTRRLPARAARAGTAKHGAANADPSLASTVPFPPDPELVAQARCEGTMWAVDMEDPCAYLYSLGNLPEFHQVLESWRHMVSKSEWHPARHVEPDL